MLKKLVLLAQVTIGAVLLPYYAPASVQQAAETHAKEVPPPAPKPVKDHAQINDYATGQTASQTAPQDDFWPMWGVFVNSLLAFITAIIAIAGLIQAIASKSAARAALKQGEHMLAAQRAWLIISSSNRTDQGSMVYWWQVKNVGETPAKIVETQALCVISGSGTYKLPSEPEFPSDIVIFQDRMLAPGDSIEFHTYWSGIDGKIFRDYGDVPRYVFMVAYGYVKYRTILDKETHESRFCDYFETSRINTQAPGLVHKTTFRPKLDIPLSYTTHT